LKGGTDQREADLPSGKNHQKRKGEKNKSRRPERSDVSKGGNNAVASFINQIKSRLKQRKGAHGL